MIIVYIIAGIIILVLIIAALLPSKYNVEISAIIKRPRKEVMDKVGDFNYFSKWNPWQLMEKEGEYKITGSPKIPGHKYSWQGRKTGVGSLTLRDMDNRHVHFDLEFVKPWKARAKDDWVFEEWGTGETKVTWQNNGELPFPLARLMGPFLKKSLDKQFAQGLNNLKRLCEAYS